MTNPNDMVSVRYMVDDVAKAVEFYTKVLDFEVLNAFPAFAWPDGIALRAYDPETDDVRVHAAHMDSFADHWGFHHFPFDEWRAHMIDQPGNDTALWKLAEADGELAGISIVSLYFTGFYLLVRMYETGDGRLPGSLIELPVAITGDVDVDVDLRSLAVRDLERGSGVGLPSGNELGSLV